MNTKLESTGPEIFVKSSRACVPQKTQFKLCTLKFTKKQ